MSAPPIGFVLAGGGSRRMGRDKALLPWDGATLLDHAIARLRALCSDVRLLCGARERYTDRGLAVLVDAWPDAGPLGGVLAGLESLDEDAAAGLFLAVDVPGAPVELLRHLADLADGWDAVVPSTPAGPEPLCALYRARCRAPIRRRLAAGGRRMDCFWPDVRVRRVEPDELRTFGDPLDVFANVNTPEAYSRFRGR